MVEEKVARTRRANERMVMDVDAAPDDEHIVLPYVVGPNGMPVLHSPDLAEEAPVGFPVQFPFEKSCTPVFPPEHLNW